MQLALDYTRANPLSSLDRYFVGLFRAQIRLMHEELTPQFKVKLVEPSQILAQHGAKPCPKPLLDITRE